MGRVIVVGSVNVDLVLKVPRLPRPGETVIGGTYQRGFGGKGANAAAAAGRLGADTWIVGRTGDDEHGAGCREDLHRSGVTLEHLALSPEPTGVASILVDDAGENLIAVASGANADVPASQVGEALSALAGPGAVVVVNLELGDAPVTAAAEGAARHGLTLVVNAAPVRPLPTAVTEVGACLTLNEHEVEALPVDDLLAGGAQAVVVTAGGRGCTLHRPGRPPHSLAALAVEAVDTTGAGDAFTAGLAVGLARGETLEEALALASAVGGLSTRALGARGALPGPEEAEAARARLG